MAQHDLTDLVARFVAAGGSREQLLAVDRVGELGDGRMVAFNRAAERRVMDLVAEAERQARARAKAQEMLDAVRGGKTLFTKSGSGWLIVGPAADMTSGATVTVTKADGTTVQVIVGEVQLTAERQGVAYATARFTNLAPVEAPRRERPVTVREVYSPVYGRGRVFSNQPGATYYESTPGSGNYAVEIWDN